MGARPSSAKTGGGFLNNVDGVITNYEFTTDAPKAKNAKGKKAGKSDFTALYFKLFAQADGAEAEVDTSLYTGINAQDVEISDDGKTLTPVEDGAEIAFPASKPFMLFMGSMCEHGFDEANLPEDGEPVNYEAIVGQRVRFVQQKDEAATTAKGPRIGKDGKSYPRQNLVVSEVYGEAEDAKPAKKGSKPAPAGKGKKAAEEDETDHTETAKEVLMAVLGTTDPINRSKLGIQALKAMLKLKTPRADHNEVLDVLKSDDFLETEDGWTYDAKKGVIASE